jgi:hypothetical protein
VSTSFLYRVAGAAGLVCAVLLVVNSARRGGVLPDSGVANAIAPFAALTGIFALTGLYLWEHVEAGRLGLVGYCLAAAGLAGAFAIEYVIHFVFRYLDKDVVTALVDGSTGRAFRVTSVVLILGVLAFGAASFRARRLPSLGVTLLVIGLIPGSLRNAVPEPVYLLGLVVAAVGIAWLSIALYTGAARQASIPGGHHTVS